ncbi:UNVERIFIED_CONTAM: hypothetical protein Sradi_6296900 [Sesamum radiatum]|uniref:Hydroxyproline-rich glycoprotein family protein n=1 Tax=Sesamum radiatum TaxID=300843 RepID=A0AAW2KD16_SESRA
MTSVHNSAETLNAAATAIVTAENRAQPSTVQEKGLFHVNSEVEAIIQGLIQENIELAYGFLRGLVEIKGLTTNNACSFSPQKRRWGSCWSLYWCFGSYKHSKRIGHAVLISEPTAQVAVAPVVENLDRSATLMLPFIAPPSSPASFLQSDPPSATQSPAGLLSLAALSVHTYSPGGTAPIFTIGPYAYETQLVSPPVFSTFTTEPSTASFTPPPEPVQMTTPSSPEVPQLLSSSLARNRRNSGNNMKSSLSQYEFLAYESPGSALSTSGTSSPFPDKWPIVEFRRGEAPKFIGYEHFFNHKWGSRVGSGSLTPNGRGSRLGSGALTPNGGRSRLGSGALTPNGGEPSSRDCNLLENQISEVVSLANSGNELQNCDAVVDHRVSFELIGEDIPTCVVSETFSSPKMESRNLQEATAEVTGHNDFMEKVSKTCRKLSNGEPMHDNGTISLGSSKDFNFNNADGELSARTAIDCEWWTNEDVVGKELGPRNNWTFFPMLQSGVS